MTDKNKIKQISKIAVLLVLTAGGIFSLINMKTYFIDSETKQLEALDIIYNNVYIRGEAVGGLTVSQAIEKTDKYINGEYAADKMLTFRVPTSDYEKSFTYPELGMGFDVKKAVGEAYNFGRSSNGSANRSEILELDMGGKYIDAEYSYSIEQVKECLASIEADVNRALEPVGKTMDIDRTAGAAEELLRVNEYDAMIIIATE